MYLHGTFTNINGKDVTAEILTGGDDTDVVTIAGSEEAAASPDTKLWFAGDNPVQIETGCSDLTTHLICTRAVVTLLSRGVQRELFQSSVHDARVSIRVDRTCVFYGYLEPRVYTQDYSDEVNQLQLNCVDCLTATKYSYFRCIHTTADYELVRRDAGSSTFFDLIAECLDAATDGIMGNDYGLYCDGSLRMDENTYASQFLYSLSVADVLWLGDEENDTKTHEEILTNILQYLNLHMAQVGKRFLIYSYESIRKGGGRWFDLSHSASDYAGTPLGPSGTAITADMLHGNSPRIDIGEVFNQVVLNISTKSLSNALVSPFDSSSLSPVSDRFYYVTEYAADGEGTRAGRAFWNLVTQGADNGYNGGMVYKDYAVKLMESKNWKIGHGTGPGTSVVDEPETTRCTTVDALITSICARLLQVGIRDHKPGKGDTNKEGQLAMSDYLVVSVNGNGEDGDSTRHPTEEDIKRSIPVAQYVGGDGNAVYSPADENSHNYLVISGSIIMNPRYRAGYTPEIVRISSSADAFVDANRAQNMAPSRNNKDGRYLCFEWWNDGIKAGYKGWTPYTGDGPQEYEYKSPGDFDKIDKVDVLWCMLRIGDKVLVEKKVDDEGNDLAGAIEDFSWRTYKTLDECKTEHPDSEQEAVDAYLEQTFTIGIDPVIGDHVVGDEFSIQTNFDANTNINASEGMAIPLPYADHLGGKIDFQILGPDDGYWSNYHKKRHATMFRHSKWGTDNIPLLSHLSSIIVKNLEVKMYGDVANSNSDAEFAYVSDVTHDFYNRKEIAGAMVHSGFTTEEISRFDLSGSLLASTVRGQDGGALLSIYNHVTGETGKPEQLYVNELYDWLSTPRLQLTMEIKEDSFEPFGTYTLEPLGKNMAFMVLNSKWSLRDGYVKVTLMEL